MGVVVAVVIAPEVLHVGLLTREADAGWEGGEEVTFTGRRPWGVSGLSGADENKSVTEPPGTSDVTKI
jgi:hypothetical protein